MTRHHFSTLLVLAMTVVLDAAAIRVQAEPEVPCGDPGPNDQAVYTSCDPSQSALWTVRADAVVLHRDRPAGDVLFENVYRPAENMRGSDFDFGYHAGVDLTLIRQLDVLPDLEFRYLRNDGWSSSTSAATSAADPLRINTAIPIFLPSGRNIYATDVSRLDNLEINFRHKCDWLTWLAGFRYMELDEGFHAELLDAAALAPPVTYDTTTQNRLYGLQLGVDAPIWHSGRMYCGVVAKGALLQNSGRQDSALATPAFQSLATGSEDHLCVLGEASLTARYFLFRDFSIRAGYSLLALDGLVLATDQVNATSFATGTGVSGDGAVFYHGAFLGIEYVR